VKPVLILVLLVNMILVTVPHVQESEILTPFQPVTVQLNTSKTLTEPVLLVTILVENVKEPYQHVFPVHLIALEHSKMMDLVLVTLDIPILVSQPVPTVTTNV